MAQDKGKRSSKPKPATARGNASAARKRAATKRNNIRNGNFPPEKQRDSAAKARSRAQVKRAPENKQRSRKLKADRDLYNEFQSQQRADRVERVKRRPGDSKPKRPRTGDNIVGSGGNRGSAFNRTPPMPRVGIKSIRRDPSVPNVKARFNKDGTRFRSI